MSQAPLMSYKEHTTKCGAAKSMYAHGLSSVINLIFFQKPIRIEFVATLRSKPPCSHFCTGHSFNKKERKITKICKVKMGLLKYQVSYIISK